MYKFQENHQKIPLNQESWTEVEITWQKGWNIIIETPLDVHYKREMKREEMGTFSFLGKKGGGRDTQENREERPKGG